MRIHNVIIQWNYIAQLIDAIVKLRNIQWNYIAQLINTIVKLRKNER